MDSRMAGSWELLDHTGDIGLRVRGETLEEVFVAAAEGMYAVLVEAPVIRPQREALFVVEGETTDELLRAWLGELLYRFSVEGMIFREFRFTLGPSRLEVRARGESMDPGRHRLCTELKAVTWHGLFVRRENEGWMAEVIFDI